jgi:UDP-N-acetylglucosamine--N-acetylmuramyl-(pentapeptide) pyrophosphoryl-undecaprenol N-acetylglucosamine transferase
MSTASIVIMAGGTGGHVFPGLALASALQARGAQVHWLGSKQSFESKLIPEKGLSFHGVNISGWRGKGWRQLLLAPFQLMRALWQAMRILRQCNARAAISFGGFAAGPGGLAARALGIPLYVHEQNRVAGLTNKVLAKLAKRVYCGFPNTIESAHSIFVGNPVRAEIVNLPPPEQRFADRTGALRILCIGGSLGAKALNDLLPTALAAIDAANRPKVLHQSGAKLLEQTQALYAALNLDTNQVCAFITDMAQAYAWADLVICRAGALTVAELAAAGVGSLFVPYPFAVDDHQTANAQFLVQAGSADLIQQKDLTAEQLSAYLSQLSRAECLSKAIRARAAAKTDAAETIARELCESQAAQSAVDKLESQAARSAVDKLESQAARSAVDKDEPRS